MQPGEQQPGGQPNPQPDPQGPPPPPPGDGRPQSPPPGGGSGFGPPPSPGQPPAQQGPTPPGFGQPQYGSTPPAGRPQYGQNPYGRSPYGTPGHPAAYGYPQQQPQQGFAQPPYAQQPQQWGAPGHPTMPPDKPGGGGGSSRATVIAVCVAVAVIIAGVVVVLAVRGGGKTAQQAGPSTSVSAPASPSASPSASAGEPSAPADDEGPRGSGGDVKAVVPDWQAVARGDRKVAYDVPATWDVQNPSEFIGFADAKGNPAITVGGAAEYQDNWCGKDTSLAATGSKGGAGAKSLQSAAEATAETVAYYGYNDLEHKKTGRLTYTKAVPFSNAHGIKGYLSTASETGVPVSGKCKNGTAYVIAWPGANNQLTEWVLWTATGVPGTVPAATIETIEKSVRQIP